MPSSRDRRLDRFEALANAVAGIVLSMIAVHLLWPLFGWQASHSQAAGVTAVFFALSIARSYVLRRLFRRLGQR